MWNWQKRLAFSLFEQEERAYELMTSLDADEYDDPDFYSYHADASCQPFKLLEMLETV